MAKKMARKGRTKVIYKGTFISKQSLFYQYQSILTQYKLFDYKLCTIEVITAPYVHIHNLMV